MLTCQPDCMGIDNISLVNNFSNLGRGHLSQFYCAQSFLYEYVQINSVRLNNSEVMQPKKLTLASVC